ncbi:hypothetical protein WJX74_009171 [Apatococcus lobatus]|uniref:Uncharacterized protein n=1 Tax=Apatococcus lobatus TaxID=904363 RepID=A0AAW1RZ08_9CHLO
MKDSSAVATVFAEGPVQFSRGCAVIGTASCWNRRPMAACSSLGCCSESAFLGRFGCCTLLEAGRFLVARGDDAASLQGLAGFAQG